jgi:asparagine synthase (glutamine-hydrolysing)
VCGITATFAYRASAPDRAVMDRTLAHMATRGPDGDGQWWSSDGRVGLGHRRLAIIGLGPTGAQPMTNAGQTVTFNGEIYNYRALRRALEDKGHGFRSNSDTEVLLRLYAEYGVGMMQHLRGMFAFALWDEDRQGLLLARDPYGIKPLYVADDGRTLRAASQVKALLAGGGVDTEREAAGHVGFYLWGHVPEPYTLYRGIRALPAGHTMWVDGKGARTLVPFASLREELQKAEQHPLSSVEDAAVILREALVDTVQHHLEADVEVGLFLSSGLDSATLAALATEVGGRVRTITLGFEEYEGMPSDEVPLAEMLAQHYGTRHTTVRIRREDFEAGADDLMARMDQPTLDGLNSYFVSRAAAQEGLKVALSGLGGDELFGGYPSFNEIPRLVRTLQRVPGITAVGRGVRVVSSELIRRFTSPKYAGLLEYGSNFGGAYLLRRGLFMPWELPIVLDPDLARQGWAALQPLSSLEASIEGLTLDRFKVTALESQWYMRNQLLRDADWASMAHSLEVRVPLVDWTLLQRIAPVLGANPGMTKQAMAATARPPLPLAIRQRPKTGFTTPVRTWIAQGHTSIRQERGLRGWTRHVHQAYTA